MRQTKCNVYKPYLILCAFFVALLLLFALTAVTAENGVLARAAENDLVITNSFNYTGNPTPIIFTYKGRTVAPRVISYISGAANPETPPTNAGFYNGIYYELEADGEFFSGYTTLTINKISANIVFEGIDTNRITYSQFQPFTAVAYGGADGFRENLTVTYDFPAGTIQPDIGSYTARANFQGSTNYYAQENSYTFTIIPMELAVIFEPANTFVYTGRPVARQFSYSTSAFPEDKGSITALYNGSEEVKDAGTYNITLYSNNPNFTVGTITGGTQMVINKVLLTVKAEDVTVLYGDTPEIVLTYHGFVEGENESVLTEIPIVTTVPTQPGEHVIRAEGGSSLNYNIVYLEGVVTVNRTQLTYDFTETDIKITMKGSFLPNSALIGHDLKKDALTLRTIYEQLKNANQVLSSSDIEYAYEVKFSEGGMSGSTVFQITLSNLKTSYLFRYRVGIIDANGNFYRIENYSLNGGTLTFHTYTDGYIVVYRDSIFTYIIALIAGITVIVFLAIKIGNHLSYRKLRAETAEAIREKKLARKKKPSKEW